MSQGSSSGDHGSLSIAKKRAISFIPLASPTFSAGKLVLVTRHPIQLPPRHPWYPRNAVVRRCPRACSNQSEPTDLSSPPPSAKSESSHAHLTSKTSRAIQRRMSTVPTLFRGPEGVLGVVLAAAALLVDFAKTLTRLAMRPSPGVPILKTDLRDVDASITSLQSALDASKAALAETERQLDSTIARASTAEGAIAAMDDTRAAITAAREQANDAQERLTVARDALRLSNNKQMDAADAASTAARECSRLERTIALREAELADVCERLEKARVADTEEASNVHANEQALAEELTQREKELAQALSERDEVQRRSAELKKKAGSLEVEASAAAQALSKTESELKRIRTEVKAREKEWKNMERESERVLQQCEETERLRVVVERMEIELKGLQEQLRIRDEAVQSVATESDQLRSTLAAREAELRELSQRLQSAESLESDRGGDYRKSEMNLDEVKSSVEAGQLSLAAEIARAKVATGDVADDVVDPLDRVKKEFEAESGHLQADMIRASAAVKRGTEEMRIKDKAIQEVMELSEDEDDAAVREIFGFGGEDIDTNEETRSKALKSDNFDEQDSKVGSDLNELMGWDDKNGRIGASELFSQPWLGSENVSEEEMRNILKEINGGLSEQDEYVLKEMFREEKSVPSKVKDTDSSKMVDSGTSSESESVQGKTTKAKKGSSKAKKRSTKSRVSEPNSSSVDNSDGSSAEGLQSKSTKKKPGRPRRKK